MPTDQGRAGDSLRELPVACSRCRWTLTLKPSLDNPANYDITVVDGWTIEPDQDPLCDRCSAGWQPRLMELSAVLNAARYVLDAETAGYPGHSPLAHLRQAVEAFDAE